MAHRRIGQESLGFGPEAGPRRTSLDDLGETIDWSVVASVLAPIYNAAKGERGWPPLSLFKALLLAMWHDLSDVQLADTLSDRASFRRFCGFASDEATPERTAFVRFRRELVQRKLDRALFEAITLQLEAKGAVVRKGTLIDATIIGSASKTDEEAAWVKHRTRAPAHGYKAHVAADKDTGIIREVEITPANEHDGSIAPAIIPHDPGEVYADRAYDSLAVARAIEAKGGVARILRRGHRRLPARALEPHNRPLRAIRARIEKIFGTWKRSYRFRQMRWMGFAKAALNVHLVVIAYNYRRFARLTCA